MKRILTLAAAFAALAACTKTTVYDDSRNEISLSPVTYNVTKAGPVYGPIDGTAYPVGESFGVFAQHTTAAAGEIFSTGSENLNEYLENVEFVKDASSSEWHGATTYYWPKTGSLYFAGYSPYSATGTKKYDFIRAAPSLTITDFEQGTYSSTDNKMVDLMWFDATSESYDDGAPAVTFSHALSWLTINIKCNSGLNDLFTIKNVTIENVNNKGTFTSKGSKDDAVWTSSVPSAITVFSGTQNITDTEHQIDGLLVIPQETQNIVITYTQKAASGTNEIEQTFTAKLDGGDGSANKEKWLLGRHYIYTITFSADEIKLTPSVEDWVDTTGGNITIE